MILLKNSTERNKIEMPLGLYADFNCEHCELITQYWLFARTTRDLAGIKHSTLFRNVKAVYQEMRSGSLR